MVLVDDCIQAANVGESDYFSDFIGGHERANDVLNPLQRAQRDGRRK